MCTINVTVNGWEIEIDKVISNPWRVYFHINALKKRHEPVSLHASYEYKARFWLKNVHRWSLALASILSWNVIKISHSRADWPLLGRVKKGAKWLKLFSHLIWATCLRIGGEKRWIHAFLLNLCAKWRQCTRPELELA